MKVGGGDLLALTAELVAIPSVSRDEAQMAERAVEALGRCPWLTVTRIGNEVVARTDLGRSMRLLVAGHTDTVPPAGNETPRVVDDALWGIGACDMKGGLAVMLDVATTVREPAIDVTWCFYTCEEIAREHNGLGRLWAERPDLLAADAAVLMEPTNSLVEAGCQGTLRVVAHLGGVRAHTARPYMGQNAVHRLAPLLERVAGWKGRDVEIDGCVFAEQLQAVAVEGGVAGNVVPDHAAVALNHRFAPDRTSEEAVESLAALFEGVMDASLGDRVDLIDAVDGAAPSLDHPLLRAFVTESGTPPRAKVGWTDVATMSAHGVPATNFGPGDPVLAHHPDEHVTRASLERARAVLAAVLELSPG